MWLMGTAKNFKNSVMKNRKNLGLSGLGFRKTAYGIYPQKSGPDNVLIHVIQEHAFYRPGLLSKEAQPILWSMQQNR